MPLPPPLPPAGGLGWPQSLTGPNPFFRLGLAGAAFRSCSRTWHGGRFGKKGGEGPGGRRPRAVGGQQNGQRGGELLINFPVRAAATAGSLAFTGDLLAQLLETSFTKTKQEGAEGVQKTSEEPEAGKGGEGENGHGYNVARALRMTSYGFLFYGPILDRWFLTLDTLMPGAPSVRTLAVKVAATQTILNPCLLLLVFAYHYTLMGRVSELPTKYSRDLVPTMVNGWRFWLPASVINFAIVPLPTRVLFMSSCSIVWNTYLSMTVTR